MSRRPNSKRPKQRPEGPAANGPAAAAERPAIVPRPTKRRPWFLAAAISLEVAWLAFLLVLALRS
jgi:hypothetical protein